MSGLGRPVVLRLDRGRLGEAIHTTDWFCVARLLPPGRAALRYGKQRRPLGPPVMVGFWPHTHTVLSRVRSGDHWRLESRLVFISYYAF